MTDVSAQWLLSSLASHERLALVSTGLHLNTESSFRASDPIQFPQLLALDRRTKEQNDTFEAVKQRLQVVEQSRRTARHMECKIVPQLLEATRTLLRCSVPIEITDTHSQLVFQVLASYELSHASSASCFVHDRIFVEPLEDGWSELTGQKQFLAYLSAASHGQHDADESEIEALQEEVTLCYLTPKPKLMHMEQLKSCQTRESKANNKLIQIRKREDAAKSELAVTKQTLETKQKELDTYKGQLEEQEEELKSVKTDFRRAEEKLAIELDTVKGQLEEQEEELKSMKTDLRRTEEKLAVAAGEAEKKLADVAAANEQLTRDAACNDMVKQELQACQERLEAIRVHQNRAEDAETRLSETLLAAQAAAETEKAALRAQLANTHARETQEVAAQTEASLQTSESNCQPDVGRDLSKSVDQEREDAVTRELAETKESLKIAHEEIDRVRAELEVARALNIQAEDLEESSDELKYKQKELARAHAVFTERTKKIESDTSELWGHVNRLQADLRRTEAELFNVCSAAVRVRFYCSYQAFKTIPQEVAEEARKILAHELAETKESLKIAQGVHGRSRAEREVAKGLDIQARGLDDTTNVEEIFGDPGLYAMPPNTWDDTVQMETAASTLAGPSSAPWPASFEPPSFGAAAGPASTSSLKNARTWETDGPPPSDPNTAQSPFIMVTDPYRPIKRPRLSGQDDPAKSVFRFVDPIPKNQPVQTSLAQPFPSAPAGSLSQPSPAVLPQPPAGFSSWRNYYIHHGLSEFAQWQYHKGRGKSIEPRTPCGPCLKDGVPCLTPLRNPNRASKNPICLRCLSLEQSHSKKCKVPGKSSSENPEKYSWDLASRSALAQFHNAVVAAGGRPGSFVVEGQPDLYTPL
ncbi:hypothetical protein FB45DRAFT_1023097 [Roridomyces roridus]|uniref:Uncharacterized protein n=1 Tax=Roridomyces roridus TaxID=1738132 RepID=A0AAD7C3H2_9AGAR|nr:hypothetical protein FB45DRAFT_1023097 [Roridomyces roridus]